MLPRLFIYLRPYYWDFVVEYDADGNEIEARSTADFGKWFLEQFFFHFWPSVWLLLSYCALIPKANSKLLTEYDAEGNEIEERGTSDFGSWSWLPYFQLRMFVSWGSSLIATPKSNLLLLFQRGHANSENRVRCWREWDRGARDCWFWFVVLSILRRAVLTLKIEYDADGNEIEARGTADFGSFSTSSSPARVVIRFTVFLDYICLTVFFQERDILTLRSWTEYDADGNEIED